MKQAGLAYALLISSGEQSAVGTTIVRKVGLRERTLADRNTMDFESPQDRPIDASPGKRPGVPIRAEPSPAAGAHWAQAEPRPSNDDHSDHEVVCLATRVTGTAQPLRGLSGMLRQRAYRIPDHRAKHWALLMFADRLDVVEDRLGSILGTPLRVAGLERLGGRVERNPIGAVSVLIVAILLLIRKAL